MSSGAVFDVVIVGAGIVGAAAARECAREGFRVCVVEGGVPASAATAAGMGHIVAMDDTPAQLALTRFSRGLWNGESTELPAEVEYVQCGTVWVAVDEEEFAEVGRKQAALAEAAVRAEVLDSAALAEAEPNLRPGLAGGLRVPEDAVVYPPAAGAFYLREAMRLGAELRRARAVRARGGAVALDDGTTLRAERIVLASGVDRALLPAVPVVRRKGHLVITERYPGFVRHQVLELGYLKSAHAVQTDSVAFNVQPRRNGQLLIGSSRQYGSDASEAEGAMVERMLARAVEYMPGLGDLAALRVWTGFRAATPDKLPLIGPAAELADGDETLWLSMGYEGLGITDAPGAARLLVDGLLGRASAIDRTPYLPERVARAVEEPVHA